MTFLWSPVQVERWNITIFVGGSNFVNIKNSSSRLFAKEWQCALYQHLVVHTCFKWNLTQIFHFFYSWFFSLVFVVAVVFAVKIEFEFWISFFNSHVWNWRRYKPGMSNPKSVLIYFEFSLYKYQETCSLTTHGLGWKFPLDNHHLKRPLHCKPKLCQKIWQFMFRQVFLIAIHCNCLKLLLEK